MKKYKVYDPETDTLKFINDRESELVRNLHEEEEIRYERIINFFLNQSDDKMECLDRLDEIVKFLCTHIRAFETERRMVYFLKRPNALLKIVEILESIRIDFYNLDSKTQPISNANKTVRQIAIMHHYLQEAGEEKYFENLPQTKEQSIQTLAESHKISPNTFTQHYNLIDKNQSERLKNVDDLRKVLNLVPSNSKAHKILIDEIRIAEQLNPLK